MEADADRERPGGDRATLAAFAVGSLLAGGNAVGVRFSNRELPPLWGAGLRFAAAAVLLVVIMAALRLGVPRGRALLGAILFGTLNFFGAFALAYYALIRLHAGFGQIILALVPLATLLLAVAWRLERLRLAAVGGALLSLGGVAVMSGPTVREGIPLVSVLASLGSAVCFAQAAVVVRRFPPVHPVAMNAVAMTAGAGLLLAASAIAGETWTLPALAPTWTALAYLVVVGSVAVFLLYLFVLGRWAASRSAYTFVIIPVVTVALSAWLDEEPIGLALVVGGVMVLAGVYVGALRPGTGSAAH